MAGGWEQCLESRIQFHFASTKLAIDSSTYIEYQPAVGTIMTGLETARDDGWPHKIKPTSWGGGTDFQLVCALVRS